MGLVNRIALIVRPKRRYKEWADSVAESDEDPEFDLDDARGSPSVYLIAPREPEILQDVIDEYAADIFEDQLDSWHTDEARWPANRTPHLFRDWFDVSLSPWVVDLDEGESPDPPVFCAWCGKTSMTTPGW